MFFQYRQIFKHHSFDYVFTYTVKPNVYASIAASFNKLPTISVVSGRGYSYVRNGWLNKLVKRLYRFAIKYNEQVWFVNKDDLQFFVDEKLVEKNKTQLLPGEGVNTKYFSRVNYSNHNKNDTMNFLFSGRLIWSKGLNHYIEAAKYIQQKYPNTRFNLLGYFGVQNPDAIAIEQIEAWQTAGIVKYEGFTDDVRPFLAKTDCFILPSYYGEGTPRSLLEAASMEIPIITTDSVGCKEVVKNGVNGYLCQPKETKDLIDKIEQFIQLSWQERLDMGKNGRIIVKQLFDEQLVVPYYLDLLFPSVLNGKTSKTNSISSEIVNKE